MKNIIYKLQIICFGFVLLQSTTLIANKRFNELEFDKFIDLKIVNSSNNASINDLKVDAILLNDLCVDTNLAPKYFRCVVENLGNQELNNILAIVKWGNSSNEKAFWQISKVSVGKKDTLIYNFPSATNLYKNKFISVDFRYLDDDTLNNKLILNFNLSSKSNVNYISASLKNTCEGVPEVLYPNDRLKRSLLWYDAPTGGNLISSGPSFSITPSKNQTLYMDLMQADRVDSISVQSITDTKTKGVYFQVENNNNSPRVIHSFELSAYEGLVPLSYEIYFRMGSYSGYENKQNKWIYFRQGSSLVNDFGNALIKLDSVFILNPNDTISFFVFGTGNSLSSSYLECKTVSTLSSVYLSKNLKITYGKTKFSSNAFTGTISNSRSIRIVLNFNDLDKCLLNARIPYQIVVNPYLKSTVFPYSSNIIKRKGTYNDPDIICNGVPNFYSIGVPLGYSESEYGIKWQVDHKRIVDTSGLIMHQNSDTSRVFYFTPLQLLDNRIYKLYYSILNLETNCYTTISRYLKVIPDNRAEINYHGTKLKCEYDSITIKLVNQTNIGSEYRYLWSTGDTSSSIRVFNTGKYKVTVFNGNCTSYSDSVIIANAVNKDSLPIIVNYYDSCYVELYTLLIPNSKVYWNMGDGTILEGYKVKYRYSNNGNYHVKTSFISNSMYCMPDSVSEVTININCLQNFLESFKYFRFNIYPNPTNGIISLDHIDGYVKSELIDMNGRVINTFNSTILNIKDIASGMYFIRVYTDASVGVGKFVK